MSKGESERRVSASMHEVSDSGWNVESSGGKGERREERQREREGKLDEARFSKRRLFFPGHWAVQSFHKSRLLRNYELVDPTAMRRDAVLGRFFCAARETMTSLGRNKKLASLAYRE